MGWVLSQLRDLLIFLWVLIISPNAEEAFSFLSLPKLPTKNLIEHAANMFLDMGVGEAGGGCVIIRSGAMGAYVITRAEGGRWVDAFWADNTEKIVDVTGRSTTVGYNRIHV
jgi:hypothetical protein